MPKLENNVSSRISIFDIEYSLENIKSLMVLIFICLR